MHQPQHHGPTTRPRPRLIASPRTYVRKRAVAWALDEAGYHTAAQSMLQCSEAEALVWCGHCGHSWYVPYRCRQRACPICARREAKQRQAHLLWISKCSRHYPKLLTLTMPRWHGHPRDGIRTIRQAWTKLQRRHLMRDVEGGAMQIELKYKPNGWHIHLHALIDAGYIPIQRIHTAWSEIIGIPAPQVHISPAVSDDEKFYVCKYACKASDFKDSPKIAAQWAEAVKGSRLFTFFGRWHNYPWTEALTPANDILYPNAHQWLCPHCGRPGLILRYATSRYAIAPPEEWDTICQHLPPDDMRPLLDIVAIVDEEYVSYREAAQIQEEKAHENMSAHLDLTR